MDYTQGNSIQVLLAWLGAVFSRARARKVLADRDSIEQSSLDQLYLFPAKPVPKLSFMRSQFVLV
jgi:hypothetical protein